MRRTTGLLGTTALGLVLGAVLMNASPSLAQMATIDVAAIKQQIQSFAQETGILNVLNAMNTVQSTINQTMSDIKGAIGPSTYGDTNTLLQQGFTQNANYAKAQVGAMGQLADASNTANTLVQRTFRNAQLRDDHTLSPQACMALNFGQSITIAAGQSSKVSASIGLITDRRGQALPGTPAHEGEGQAIAAVTQLHLTRYCSEDESAAGLCTVDPTRQNLDQSAGSLTGFSVYDATDNNGVNAANDFATNLIQTVVPGAIRGDALTSAAGQDAEARRRRYNAKISMARKVTNDIIGSRTISANLTADQKQQMVDQGLTPSDQSSWLGALDLEVNRRSGGTAWHASLQAMPPKSVMVEIATELAMGNTIAIARLKLEQQHAAVSAALLATAAEAELKPVNSMPTPQMASQ
jgi:hypothetical protein